MKVSNLTTALTMGVLFFTFGCRQSSDYTKLNINSARVASATNYELYGNTSGYGVLKTDGIADFGLVLKSFTKEKLFEIELNDLMSTEFDRISIIGNNIEIPSNVALPNQKERYILSITLNKPTYKIQFDQLEDQRVVLLHGQFPFNDVVQGFRNDQPLLKLADKFNVLSFSEYSFDNTNNSSRMNLDLVAGQKKHTQNIQVKAPARFGKEYSYVVVALDQADHVFLANNLTVLAPNESKNLKITGDDTYIFSGLVHESFSDSESTSMQKHKMSFQMLPAGLARAEILDFIENLKYNNENLTFTLPNNLGLIENGLAYNIVEINRSGVETILVQDFTTGPWSDSLNLSGFESLRKANHTYRLDLFVGASLQNQMLTSFEDVFESSDLITRNSINL